MPMRRLLQAADKESPAGEGSGTRERTQEGIKDFGAEH